MPRLSGRSSRGFGASGSFPGGLGSAVAILDYAAQERIMAQYLYEHAGVPTDGTNGTYAHVAPPGALLIDTDAKTLYQNTGTQASPMWTERSAPSGGGSGVLVSDPVTITKEELWDLHNTPKVLMVGAVDQVVIPDVLSLLPSATGAVYEQGAGDPGLIVRWSGQTGEDYMFGVNASLLKVAGQRGDFVLGGSGIIDDVKARGRALELFAPSAFTVGTKSLTAFLVYHLAP